MLTCTDHCRVKIVDEGRLKNYKNSGIIFLQTIYFVWVLNVFFGYKSIAGYMKVPGALFIIGLIEFIILLVALFFYIPGRKF